MFCTAHYICKHISALFFTQTSLEIYNEAFHILNNGLNY
jgi:hypothetical protein